MSPALLVLWLVSTVAVVAYGWWPQKKATPGSMVAVEDLLLGDVLPNGLTVCSIDWHRTYVDGPITYSIRARLTEDWRECSMVIDAPAGVMVRVARRAGSDAA